jgi:hypothetical protein
MGDVARGEEPHGLFSTDLMRALILVEKIIGHREDDDRHGDDEDDEGRHDVTCIIDRSAARLRPPAAA